MAYIRSVRHETRGSEVPSFDHVCSECGESVSLFALLCPRCGADFYPTRENDEARKDHERMRP